MTDDPAIDFEALLRFDEDWLRRRCSFAARSRHGLDADDLAQDVRAAYLVEAPAWFAQGPTLDPVARSRRKLNFLVMHRVTTYDRETRRRGAEEELETLPAPEPDLGERLLRIRAHQAIDGLSNASYRLALRAVYREMEVEAPEFEAARASFLRALDEAWVLFEAHRLETAEREWRRVVAEIVRCVARLGESSAAEAKTARDWLDRTVQRAIACVVRDLARAEASR